MDHLDFMKYGVATAQKGFVNKDRVINTMTRDAFKTLLIIILNYRNRGLYETKTLDVLEFDKIKSFVASETISDLGREKCLKCLQQLILKL